MIPDTVFGLLVVAAGLGPGYVFVRIAERRNPRPARSALLEVAELVTVGASCSTIAVSVALLIANAANMDLRALAKNGREYALTHPLPVVALLLGALVGGYALAAGAAFASHRRLPATLRQHSVWHELMRKQEAGRPFATVELRDGRIVAGPVAYYTVEEAPPDERELTLITPIRARADARSEFVDVDDDRVVLRASDISALSVKYF